VESGCRLESCGMRCSKPAKATPRVVSEPPYFLQTVEELAHRYGVRAWPSDLNGFSATSSTCSGTAHRRSVAWAGEHQPRPCGPGRCDSCTANARNRSAW